MKKTKLFLLGAILASFSFSATAQALDEAFNPDGFPAYQITDKNSGRKLTSFQLTNTAGNVEALNEPTFDVNQSTANNSKLYYDLKDSAPFQTRAGNTVKFGAIKWPFSWMHAYLFIDYNQDLPKGGGFNSRLNNTGKSFNITSTRLNDFNRELNPSADGELVSFWVYNISSTSSEYFVDSNGTYFSSVGTTFDTNENGHVELPQFTIPDLEPGTYDALFKIDWSNINQNGSSEIGTSGGVAVRFTIEVVGEHERSVTISNADEDKGEVYLEVDGARHEGYTIENTTSTVVAVAEPNDRCVFVNWTNGIDGEEVSTEARYAVTGEGEFELVAHFKTFAEAGIVPETGDDIAWLSDLEGLEGNMTLLEEDRDDKIAVRRDRSTAGNPITIMGKVYEKGIGTHATSNAYVELNGATSFYTVVGIDDEMAGAKNKTNECEVDFIITLYNSENRGGVVAYNQHVKMSESVYAFEFNSLLSNYNIADYDYMKLTVDAGTQPWSDHADWADARFQYEGIAPRFIPQTAMFNSEIRHIANTTAEVSPFADAAIVTVEYDARFIPEEHNLVAVASQTFKGEPGAGAAASYFTTLADGQVNETLNGAIFASKASTDGKTLTFDLRKDAKSANLVLEEPIWNQYGNKADNGFEAGTSYTYNIQLKTMLGEETQLIADPVSVSFTTNPDDTNVAGVEDVTADDSNAPVQYFNLQGIQVVQPAAGQIYIVRQGKTVKKVLVK